MPKLTVPRQTVPIDRDELHARQVMVGERCGSCDTLRIGAGCECERSHAFYLAVLGTTLFADANVGRFSPDPKRAGQAAVSLVSGAAWRASRRYGVPLPPGFGATLRARYGVEPRYTQPRVVEQNHLPV